MRFGQVDEQAGFYINRTTGRAMSPAQWAAWMRDRRTAQAFAAEILRTATAAAVALATVGALPAPEPEPERVPLPERAPLPEPEPFVPDTIPRGRWPSSFAAAWRRAYADRGAEPCHLAPAFTYRQVWERHTPRRKTQAAKGAPVTEDKWEW